MRAKATAAGWLEPARGGRTCRITCRITSIYLGCACGWFVGFLVDCLVVWRRARCVGSGGATEVAHRQVVVGRSELEVYGDCAVERAVVVAHV